jgi:hypothetical protein
VISKNRLKILMFVGTGHFWTTSTLLISIDTPSGPITCPKYSNWWEQINICFVWYIIDDAITTATLPSGVADELSYTHIGVVHQNIIDKGRYTFRKIRGHDLIHCALKSCWGRSEAERHHKKLIQPVISVECYFWCITFSKPDSVITRTKVQLAKHIRACQLVK